MNTKERNDLKNFGASMGLKTSSYNSNVQIGSNYRVTHIDNNRTLVNGNMHYGASNAKNALKNWK